MFELVRLMGFNTTEKRVKLLVKRFWAMVNDSCKTTLWLQFSARRLAVAIFILCGRYCGMRMDMEKLWKYYLDDDSTPSDYQSEIKRIWTQLMEEYDPKSKVHEHVTHFL